MLRRQRVLRLQNSALIRRRQARVPVRDAQGGEKRAGAQSLNQLYHDKNALKSSPKFFKSAKVS